MTLGLEIAEMRPESLAGTTNCGQLGLFTGGTLKALACGGRVLEFDRILLVF